MILDDGLNVLPPLGFGVAPDEEGVVSPAPDPERGDRDEIPATAPTAATPEEAPAAEAAEAGPAGSSEAAETTTDTTMEETE
jgi:hypothetical protein